MALVAFFSASSPALQSLSILFVGFIAVELVAALRMSVIYDRKTMLQQLLVQTRMQRDEEIHELQQELGRLRTREHALNLQVGSLQNHLEHNGSEQTRSLRGALDSLRTSEERLQRALDASGLALWDWNLVTGKVFHTGSEQLLGLKGDQASELLADLRPLMHPDDLPVLREAMTAHMREETPDYSVEYRIRHANGHWIWIEDRGQAIARDASGRVLRMLGTRRDITVRRQHEEELHLASIVFETGSEGILVMDSGLNVLTVNSAFTRITGFTREYMAPFQQHFQEALEDCGMESVMGMLKNEGSWHAELSESILRQACIQARNWMDAGNPLQVSVNLSVV
ncbi:MAG: PAS domain-containing protein, partial [Thiopseudomonas sp.]